MRTTGKSRVAQMAEGRGETGATRETFSRACREASQECLLTGFSDCQNSRQGPARLAATLLQSHAKRSPAVRHLGPSPSCLPEPPFFLEERERSGFQLHAHARLACKSVPAALPLSGNLVKTQGPSTCASACISAPVPLLEQLKPMTPK